MGGLQFGVKFKGSNPPSAEEMNSILKALNSSGKDGFEVLKKIKYNDKAEYVLRPDFINTFKMLK